MDEIAFTIDDDQLAGVSVHPVINGERLATRVGSGATSGMWPGGLAQALLPPLDERARTQVLRCGCGEAGCAYVTFEIEASEHEVVWRDMDTGRQEGGEPLRFERTAYEAALSAIPDGPAAGRADQPHFPPIGPPQTYMIVVAPGHTPPPGSGMILASFEANDSGDAKQRAKQIAVRIGLNGDPSSYVVATAANTPDMPRYDPWFPADADLTASDDPAR